MLGNLRCLFVVCNFFKLTLKVCNVPWECRASWIWVETVCKGYQQMKKITISGKRVKDSNDFRGQIFHSPPRNYKWNLERMNNSSLSTCPVGRVLWEELLEGAILHITPLCYLLHNAFKGQLHVFAGWVKIVSHLSCRTSAILKYFCRLELTTVFTLNTWVKVKKFLNPEP